MQGQERPAGRRDLRGASSQRDHPAGRSEGSQLEGARCWTELASLASLAGNSKYHVVHFWSPWSEQCEANLPDFIAMTEELARNKIPVTSVMIETGPEALKAAKEFHAGIKTENLGNWIVDNSETSLARKLRVVELPTVALLTLEGGVLFSGHPSDAAFWNALTKVAPEVKRPHLDPAK